MYTYAKDREVNRNLDVWHILAPDGDVLATVFSWFEAEILLSHLNRSI